MPTGSPTHTNASGNRADLAGIACCAIIALVVALAFLPSLAHAPRADQWPFLLDLFRQDSCSDFILNSYSYNRTRVIKPGDEALFRPLFFAYLSLMTCLSGAHIWIPQAAGIALHLGVAWLAFFLLRFLLASIAGNARAATAAAVVASLYFATTPLIMDQVAWAHINAYMLAVLCVLGVMRILAAAQTGGMLTRRQVAATFVLCLIACFTFEVTLFLPALLGLFALAGWLPTASPGRSGRNRLALAAVLSGPLLIYFTAYLADLRIHPVEPGSLARPLLDRASSWTTAHHFLRVLDFSTAYPFIAGRPEAFTGTRLLFGEPSPALRLLTLALLAGISLAAIAGAAAARRLPEPQRRVALLSGAVALAWIAAHVSIYTLGRVNTGSAFWEIIATNSYHSYAPFLATLLLVGIAAGCLSATRAMRSAPLRHAPSWLAPACAALALLTIGIRAGVVHSVNVQLAGFQAPLVDAVTAINAVRDRDPLATLRLSKESADRLETYHGVPVLYTLFARSIDQCNGTYEILAGEPHVARSPAARGCYPSLIQPHTNYLYYLYRGEVIGLPFWFGFPDDRLVAGNPYAIRAPTLEAAMRQYPAYHERMFEDLRAGRLAPPRPIYQTVPFR